MEFPTVIDLTSPFPFKGLLGGILHVYSNFNRTFCKQTLETLIRPDLGQHCLPMSHKMGARLLWVNMHIVYP